MNENIILFFGFLIASQKDQILCMVDLILTQNLNRRLILSYFHKALLEILIVTLYEYKS